MRIVVSSDSPVRLEDAADFGRFSVQMDRELQGEASRALSGIGMLSDENHVWVRPDAVRALAHRAHDLEWETSFRKMLDYAASKGWLGAAGEIRAHIDYLERPVPVSRDIFRGALRRFASGVSIVAAGDGDNRRGMTVSAFSSVSADPPTILVCINSNASTHDTIVSAERFSVNILAGDQRQVALIFAGQMGVHGAERFDGDAWRQSAYGAPVLNSSLQSLVCAKMTSYREATHTILIGRVIDADVAVSRSALINYEGDLVDVPNPARIESSSMKMAAYTG